MVISYTDWREFLQRLAMMIAALPAALHAAGGRLPIGFSTLGCPAWDWLKILDFAQQNGFAAVELRGLQGNMDLPSRPEFSSTQIAHSKKNAASRGLHLACLGRSANLLDTDPQNA